MGSVDGMGEVMSEVMSEGSEGGESGGYTPRARAGSDKGRGSETTPLPLRSLIPAWAVVRSRSARRLASSLAGLRARCERW